MGFWKKSLFRVSRLWGSNISSPLDQMKLELGLFREEPKLPKLLAGSMEILKKVLSWLRSWSLTISKKTALKPLRRLLENIVKWDEHTPSRMETLFSSNSMPEQVLLLEKRNNFFNIFMLILILQTNKIEPILLLCCNFFVFLF